LSEATLASADLPLFLWLSPAFPVGAFAYSHGLEWAVEASDVQDAATLLAWIGDLLAHGAPRTDALLTAAAWRAARAGGVADLCEANDLALALAPSRERWLETSAQGDAFALAIRDAWPSPMLASLAQRAEHIAYPIALGAASADHHVRLGVLLDASLLAFASNLVSAAVRLGPIGQTDGQRILAALIPHVRACAQFAAPGSLDDLGGAALRSDIASMRHETQYSRLFRT
jgi:urease accessory protein